MMDLAARLASIKEKITNAEKMAGRRAGGVRLVAVSKFHPVEAVRDVLTSGHRLFGENRVQEAKGKFVTLRQEFPDLELHLIGPLQTNKADEAVRLFDVIETLDRPALAKALAKAMAKTGRKIPCYIEVNIGREEQKAGVAPEDLAAFLGECRATHGLTVTGLMCIPTQGADPRPFFARMRELAKQHALPNLSMGMSGDFEQAIAEGATEIRVGTAIFGERVPSP